MANERIAYVFHEADVQDMIEDSEEIRNLLAQKARAEVQQWIDEQKLPCRITGVTVIVHPLCISVEREWLGD